MRPRAVGGLEPDHAEQRELVELWHLSRGVSAERATRIKWCVDWFIIDYPIAGRKWVYVWCERYFGRLVDPDPVEWPDGPSCKFRAKNGRSKKCAK